MRADPYKDRARELAIEAGLDPDARIERPGQRAMPLWCTFRDAARKEQLAREVAGQVRLASLQRQPVIFLRESEVQIVPPYLGQGGLFGRRGPMSGLVLLHPGSAEPAEKADWPNNTPILVVPRSQGEADAWASVEASARNAKVLTDEWNEKEGLIKEVERWLRSSGL